MKRQLFIAAGGRGTRLGAALPATMPKSMMPVGGKPIIGRIIETAVRAGVERIVVGLDRGKQSLRRYVAPYGVEIEDDCVEPLTQAVFRSAARRCPDVVIGVNGDTLYDWRSIQRTTEMLRRHPDAAAAVLLTTVTRPVLKSDWIYWSHRLENGRLVAMDEVPGHQIPQEYVMAAFRTRALEELSEGFTESFTNPAVLPFKAYSKGWDYLTRLLLWKGMKVVGQRVDDLAININYPVDLEDAEYLFTDAGFFRWRRLLPPEGNEPLDCERTLVMLKPQAHQRGLAEVLESKLAEFGLRVVERRWVRFNDAAARQWNVESCGMPWFEEAVRLLLSGSSTVFIVEGKGGFYRALQWKRTMRERFAVNKTNSLVHSTFSPWSFEAEFRRELAILARMA